MMGPNETESTEGAEPEYAEQQESFAEAYGDSENPGEGMEEGEEGEDLSALTFDALDLGDEKDEYKFKLFAGGSLLSCDGAYALLIEKVGLTKSKKGGKLMLELVASVLDDGEDKGVKLFPRVVFGGRDKNGASMFRNLGDLLGSSGWSLSEINALKSSKRPLMEVIGELQGKTVYGNCTAEAQDEYAPRSDVSQFVPSEVYEERKAYRTPHAWSRAPSGTPKKGDRKEILKRTEAAVAGAGRPVGKMAAAAPLGAPKAPVAQAASGAAAPAPAPTPAPSAPPSASPGSPPAIQRRPMGKRPLPSA